MKNPLMQIVIQLGLIDNDLERAITQKVKSAGYPHMTRIRFMILKNICETGTLNQQNIAKMTSVTPQAIHRHTLYLEQSGYITRSIQSADARAYAISITDKGTELLDKSYSIAKNILENYFKNLSRKEIEALNTLLKKVKANLH